MPRYIILPSTGGAALQILSDDLAEEKKIVEKKIVTFQPIGKSGKGGAIVEAMAFAERYETMHSLS
jgi:hypothetical protein